MRHALLFQAYSRRRWMAWLDAQTPAFSVPALARELAAGDVGEDSQPRNMVYGWQRGERTPSADSAWSAGEALQRLGYPTGGPMGLYAAGYYADAIALLARLAAEKGGSKCAVTLSCALPAAVEPVLFPMYFSGPTRVEVQGKMARFESLAVSAQAVCLDALASSAELVEQCWGAKKSHRLEPIPEDAQDEIKIAHAVALADIRDPAKAGSYAWRALAEWGARLRYGQPTWEKYHPLYVDYATKWRPYAERITDQLPMVSPLRRFIGPETRRRIRDAMKGHKR
ncbi:MAG: hypothetical protein GIX02_13330 [Candidatus Eremiobacteraeota bacterium]|nr:hypothetical protein [Candidatus Eremiobacteraeota bacterium]